MTRQEVETYANHWHVMASDAKRKMDTFDVGSIEWCEARSWYMECYARADTWSFVRDRMEEKELAA